MESKTFCILPWVHLYANPDGSVLPCCIGSHNKPLGNVRSNTIQEIWNDQPYKNMRLKMLAGERCSECTACYNNEDNNVKSFRQHSNNDYEEFLSIADTTNADGSLDSMDLKYLDIRWSNICNLKCRSCSSTYSSSWAQEDSKFGRAKDIFIFAGGDNNDQLYDQILPHLAGIKEIYFAGGEPLLTDKHYEILEHLIAIGNTDIKLRYNSNITNLKYKSKSITEYWNKFSKVILYASVDSWGDRAEYIREGTEWSTVAENIKTIRAECPHVYLEIASVISVFNIATIPEFVGYLIDNNLFDTNMKPSFYTLQNPSYYSFSVIPDDLKEQIIEKLNSTTFGPHVTNQVSNVMSHLVNSKYNENLRKELINKNTYYDFIRDRSFLDTFPELKGLYK